MLVAGTKQDKQAWLIGMPAIAASMFATATNITNIHNKTSIMHINQSIFDLDVYIQGSLIEKEGSVQLASLY